MPTAEFRHAGFLAIERCSALLRWSINHSDCVELGGENLSIADLKDLCFTASAALAVLGAIRPELMQYLRIPVAVFGIVGKRISSKAMWGFTHRSAESKLLHGRNPARC